MAGAILYQSLIKPYSWVFWRHILNQGPLLSDDFSLFQVDIRLGSTQGNPDNEERESRKAQELKVLAALAEDPEPLFSTHMVEAHGQPKFQLQDI